MPSTAAHLLLAALLFAAAPARAAAPIPEADAKLLWEEAVATHDGVAYTFTMYVFPTEEAAKACAAEFRECQKAQAKPKPTLRLPEVPMAFRAQLARLERGDLGQPVRSPGGAWLVFEPEKAEPAKFPGDAKPYEWLQSYASASLPTAEALRTDPALKARRALNWLKDAEELGRLLADGTVKPEHLDAPLSNGRTALVRAAGRGELPLVRALLEAGARPDACGWTLCPLSWAVLLGKADVARALLAAGAKAGGVPGETLPPLAAAAGEADQPLTQLLLDAGADPLAPVLQGIGPMQVRRSLLYFALSKDRAYLEWLAGELKKRLDASGAARWQAWLEQGGQRTPITAGATITLRRAPFKVVMVHPPGLEFRVAASEDASLLEKGKDLLFRRDLFHESKLGATAKDSTFLGVTTLGVEEDRLDWRTGCNDWGDVGAAARGNGLKTVVVKGRTEYVYDVTELVGLTKQGALPIAQYQGPGLAILMGARPSLGTSADLYEPIGFTLKLAGK